MTVPEVVGLAWFRRANYRQLLDLMIDRETLPTSYDTWRELAERTERDINRTGTTLIRAYLDVDEFTAFCRQRGLNLDFRGRRAFADYKAMLVAKSQSGSDTGGGRA